MAEAWWSSYQGEACIRVRGVGAGRPLEVRPATVADRAGLPSMGGRVVADGSDACFVPGFPFVDGTGYVVEAGGRPIARLVHPRTQAPPSAGVIAIRPSAAEVPRNLLRIYVWFSRPMSEGLAAEHVHLRDQDGAVMEGSLLRSDYELWDQDRCRLTVLLDPARIKRGLAPHREIGYPLQEGRTCALTVSAAFPDARGVALRAGAEHRYRVGGDERRPLDPGRWEIDPPRCGTCDPVEVTFDRVLDHGLLLRCLGVHDPAGRPIRGTVSIGPEERSWSLAPTAPWPDGGHQLAVDPVLEDVAGNSLTRAFDHELGDASLTAPARLGFVPKPKRAR